jgi:hypothetical protein
MKVYDLHDKAGRAFAFEIPNVLLGRKGACRVVRKIPGVRVLKSPKPFSWSRQEVFCEFEVSGQRFQIWEPFGDNSRYWIGPEPPEYTEVIGVVRHAFESAGMFGLGKNG